jgi:hypothetical protein
VIRLRYLVKSPQTLTFYRGQAELSGGTWQRVWSRKWERYRGEKKIVSGKFTIRHVPAERGWT